MSQPVRVSLDAIADNPALARDLAPETRAALLAQLGGLVVTVAAVPVEPHAEPPLSVKDAAARLRVSASTVRSLIARGTLRAVKVGKHVRLDPADVARVLAGPQAPLLP